ncbi:hypothetical protein B0J15DRAFT_410766 [Fusarium solani]|uniref:Xylanolytic transcriptional activator regulatory domain-containing protein n=1 Tax=Fusarium solani TaxID=169388 RepID=A0A9P9G1E7_FUSSL|nr:uncharacterized protein B0J15DRAFT_410766 [Fusarium solani]KAH7230330.1 hypothetical protein B0J15DRAFT_410766 [Fusarium solani]
MGFESDGESIQVAFDSYFKNFHPLWPILHLPTFVAATEPRELTNTVVMIGAWKLEGDYWIRKARCLQIHLIDTLQKQLLALSIEQQGEPYWPLKIYQAVLLNVAFGLESSLTCSQDDLMYPRCYLLFNMMISIFRRVGIFDEQRIIAQDKPKEVGTRRWINREQLKRLAFHAMRCDSYFQYLCYYPPVLRPEELCLTLPCSNLLWEVPTLSLWLHAKLDEPKGRISRNFASLLFDAISNDESRRARMPNLLEEDYLFGLCAIQPWIWEQVQRGRLSHQQPRGSLQRSDPSYLDCDAAPDKGLCDRSYWRHQLDLWRVSYDQDKELGFKSSSIFHIITLRFNCRLFYHLSYLALYTDLQLIDDISINRSLPFSGAIRRKREAAAEAWATTSDARLAMWHAGQILKVWHEELTASTAKDFTPGTDIISYVALFKAGIVTWAYTRATRSCDLCRIETELGQPPAISVLDLTGNSEAADLETWIDGGGREAIGGTLVCACNLADLVGRFEECLGGCPRGSSVRRMGETLASLKEQY